MEAWKEKINHGLLIVPKEEQSFFLGLKKKDPFLSFHMLSKEEVLENYYGKPASGSFFSWYKKHQDLSYPVAKLYFKEATLLYDDQEQESEKVEIVRTIRNELKEMDLLKKKPYFSYYLHRFPIFTYGYEKDAELDYLLKKEGLDYEILSLEEKQVSLSVTHFYSIEEEIASIFEQIIELYKEGVSLNQIYIFNPGKEYHYPLYRFGQDFHLPIEGLFEESTLYTEDVQALLRIYEENNSLEGADTTLSCYAFISSFIETYQNDFDKDTLLTLLKEELKKRKEEGQHYQEALRFTSRHLFHEDEYVFILGFEQGTFPIILRDDAFLSDKDKENVHQNTSSFLNRIHEKRIRDLLFLNAHVYVSYKDQASDGLHHPSMLIEKWNLEKKEKDFRPISHSLAVSKKEYGRLLDYQRKYGVTLKEIRSYAFLEPFDFASYDHCFQGTSFYQEDQELLHSYSALKIYAQCPYHYYLQKCLGLDPFEENFYTKFGVLAHKIMEHVYEQDVDYDALFYQYKEAQTWDEKEQMLLIRLQKELKVIFLWNQEHFAKMDHPLPISETSFQLKLHDKAYLKGIIDRVIFVGKEHDYAAIIDYKTGQEKFVPYLLEVGYSLQLPIYGLLLKQGKTLRNLPNRENLTIMGTYIQQILPSKPVPSPKTLPIKEKQFYKLMGLTLDQEKAILPFDPDFHESPWIYGLKCGKNGFGRGAKVFSLEEWESFENTTMEQLLMMDDEIRKNHFPIRPKRIQKSDLACTYCPFKDICYMEEKDVLQIKIKAREDDENGEVDE